MQCTHPRSLNQVFLFFITHFLFLLQAQLTAQIGKTSTQSDSELTFLLGQARCKNLSAHLTQIWKISLNMEYQMHVNTFSIYLLCTL